MNSILWKQIEDFNLDYPLSEYSFSIRLADENYWTTNFTENAILEYKKFMYLAATSDSMVSPSEIIDVVWHQHLIFTQSYNEFCDLLGKRIEHIPSTRTRSESEKFKLAKEKTNQLYEASFGKQPGAVWNYSNIYESLQLKKARLKVRTFLVIGISSAIILFVPLYYALRNIYIKIDNPGFLYGYYAIIIVGLLSLQIYNRTHLFNLLKKWNPDSFVFNLTPHELVFAKTNKLDHIIHNSLNEMVKESKVTVARGNMLLLNDDIEVQNSREFAIKEVIKFYKKIDYSWLLKMLVFKPAFKNAEGSINAFKKYFSKSIIFGRLFYLNFIILATIFLLGAVRLTTGLSRDKPVTIILCTLIVYGIFMVIHLMTTVDVVTRYTIPDFYKSEIIPANIQEQDVDWSYFLIGVASLTPAFRPVVRDADSSTQTDSGNSWFFSGGSSSSSCGGGGSDSGGSGCGSSCGSSCGGCGGGD